MKRIRINLSVFVIFLILLSNNLFSQTRESRRAMLIYNIASAVTWENQENITKFTIGVFSSNKEFDEIKKLVKFRKIAGKPVEVIHYINYANVKPNHIVYITKNENANLGFIYQKLKGKNVLIISDQSKQVKYSVINLNKPNSKQIFTINSNLCKTQKLKLSHSLIRIGGTREELKKIQNDTNKKLIFEKKELENKKIEIIKINKELIQAKKDLGAKDKEIEILKEKLSRCEEGNK